MPSGRSGSRGLVHVQHNRTQMRARSIKSTALITPKTIGDLYPKHSLWSYRRIWLLNKMFPHLDIQKWIKSGGMCLCKKKIQTGTYPPFKPFYRLTVYLHHSSSGDKFLSSLLWWVCECIRASAYACVSTHVYVSCVGPIISLALLSSPVCLSGALCLLGAACPPKWLLQRNYFKT